MTAFPRHRIRLAPDVKSHALATDIISGGAPLIWRGTSLQVEVGLLFNGVLQTDISNIASLYLEIHSGNRTGGPLLQKILLAAALHGTVTAEEWATGAADKYHALFELNYADTQLPMDSDSTLQQKRIFWLVIHAVTTDATPRRITWGGCNLEVEEDAAQNDLAVVPMSAPSFRTANGDLQIYNKTTGKFHAIWFEGEEGAETIKYGAGQS
jgi:hypothetical protein